jgi:hypothetical protein
MTAGALTHCDLVGAPGEIKRPRMHERVVKYHAGAPEDLRCAQGEEIRRSGTRAY